MTDLPTLVAGSTAPEVTQLQDQLLRLGLLQAHSPGEFCAATERAMRSFQIMRGIRADSIAGPQTWSALSESGIALGNRLLSLRAPMMRGDDVLELQLRLDRLGFRVGRVDGILGPDTAGGVREFQRNVGIAVDAICGPDTVASLNRLSHLAGGRISELTELERFRETAGNGLAILLLTSDREFELLLGSDVGRHQLVGMLPFDPEKSSAQEANQHSPTPDLVVAIRTGDVAQPVLQYFELGDARSAVGRALAETVLALLPGLSICGMSSTVLRETKAPALLFELPVAESLGTKYSPGELFSTLIAAIDVAFSAPSLAR